ncbi:Transcriptional regulator of nonfermentable carbon utilization, partial [Elasticomyces elasticus]
MSPDADDASPSPEPSRDRDSGNMAEISEEHAASDEQSPVQTSNGQTAKSNAKDPLRPRRKKARRACFACQRAHLTCGMLFVLSQFVLLISGDDYWKRAKADSRGAIGDERPCLRCIKRGLQDQCHDGVRKKAKYLHDAPNEALMPGIGGHFAHLNASRQSQALPGALPNNLTDMSMPQATAYYGQGSSTEYPRFTHDNTSAHSAHSMHDSPGLSQYPQQTVLSPAHFRPNSSQNTSPVQDLSGAMAANSADVHVQTTQYGAPLFDPSDPSPFNFDVSGLNFGNHYGALEFGMLGHMSSGAVGTPEVDANLMNPKSNMQPTTVSMDPHVSNAPGYGGNVSNLDFHQNPTYSTWPGDPSGASRQSNLTQLYNANMVGLDMSGMEHQSGLPHAFAIGEGPSSLASTSPLASGVEFGPVYQSSPLSPATFFTSGNIQQAAPEQKYPGLHQQRQQPRSDPSFSTDPSPHNGSRKRRRDTSEIYAVDKP